MTRLGEKLGRSLFTGHMFNKCQLSAHHLHQSNHLRRMSSVLAYYKTDRADALIAGLFRTPGHLAPLHLRDLLYKYRRFFEGMEVISGLGPSLADAPPPHEGASESACLKLRWLPLPCYFKPSDRLGRANPYLQSNYPKLS